MEYEKIMNLLDKTPNQPCKVRTKNWVEINDDGSGTCNKDCQIKFKTSMLKSKFYDYSDAYVVVSETITINEAGDYDNAKQLDERNNWVIFENWAPFIDCISEINNTQINNTKDLDVMMPMCNWIQRQLFKNITKLLAILQRWSKW